MHKRTFLVCTVLLISVLAGVTAVSGQTTQTPTPTPETTNNSTSAPAGNATNATNVTTTPMPTATPTPTPTPEPTATPTPERASNDSGLIEINPTARVISTSWEEGSVAIVVETDYPQTISVTDASIDLQKHEAHDIPQTQRRVVGRTTITFSTTYPDTAAVTVGSSEGGLVGLSPGTGGGLFARAASWMDVRIAVIFALFGIPGMALGVWAKVAKRSVDVELVDPEDDD